MRSAPALLTSLLLCGSALTAQQAKPEPTGWELTGIPALNFNADEGFGFGVIVQAFQYAPGLRPYRLTIQPTVFLTTKGRRDVSVFIDAPHVLPNGYRLGAYVAREQQLATSYYGIGNGTAHDESAELEPNPYFYRYGRTGYRVTADIQRSLGHSLRVLGGGGFRTTEIDKTPFDSGTTLLVRETGTAPMATGHSTYLRAGLVFDTRDQEVGPRHGAWVETLVQVNGRSTPSTGAFTRMTLTARGYATPTDRVTFAERAVLQNLNGNVPFYELFAVQGSFKDDESLGGSSSLRGWPKNRFAGKGLALLNNEVRVRAADFTLRGRPSSVVINGFVDAGRVWADHLRLGELATDLHVGVGGGARLAYGRNFVIAVDAGHSAESTGALYIGLGYLY